MKSSHSLRSGALAAVIGAMLLAACSDPAGTPYEPPAPAEPAAVPAPEAASEAVDDSPAAGEDPFADPALDAEEAHADDEAGEVHEHGAGELAVTREDDFLTMTLEAPLANFGLSESDPPGDTDAEAYADNLAEPMGPTRCEETERSVTARSTGSHGAMTVSIVWRCKKIERIEGMRFNIFNLYPGFRHIDAVYLGPDGHQAAQELTPDNAELDFY
ncbi:MAG: DUF2796 domain-containing protein [Hyphomonas sp.]|uniref:ZrgA family zinc uptake protein n=1 Tax=Hyphomonas sp. TaxID=87 RepID=UPI0035273B1E